MLARQQLWLHQDMDSVVFQAGVVTLQKFFAQGISIIRNGSDHQHWSSSYIVLQFIQYQKNSQLCTVHRSHLFPSPRKVQIDHTTKCAVTGTLCPKYVITCSALCCVDTVTELCYSPTLIKYFQVFKCAESIVRKRFLKVCTDPSDLPTKVRKEGFVMKMLPEQRKSRCLLTTKMGRCSCKQSGWVVTAQGIGT